MNILNTRPIGMFDSGVGGLSVLRAFRELLPGEDILYFADTLHVPYGEKTAEEIAGYGRQIAEYFKEQEVKLLIIACNTATVFSLDAVKEVMREVPVLGIIGAGSRALAEGSGGERVGVLATTATIRSSAYPEAIKTLDESIDVVSLAAQRFVTLVEAGDTDSQKAREIVREDLLDFAENPPSKLLLGCTHFPGLAHLIQEVLPGVTLIDPAKALAEEARELLKRENLLRNKGGGSVTYFVSGDPASFSRSGSILLGQPIEEVFKLIL